MANSTYNILEMRVIDRGPEAPVEAYVLIDNPTDFLPVGGWYSALVPTDRMSLDFLGESIATQSFLHWEQLAPDRIAAWQQAEIKRLQEQILELCGELARRQLP